MLRVAAEPPTAGYQCMVEGCPAKHVSKREVCGSEANVPANTALLEMRAAFTEAIALLRRWRKRESDCIPAGAGGDYRLFSETGMKAGHWERTFSIGDHAPAETKEADPLGAETRAATSRDARSTDDAGRPQPSGEPSVNIAQRCLYENGDFACRLEAGHTTSHWLISKDRIADEVFDSSSVEIEEQNRTLAEQVSQLEAEIERLRPAEPPSAGRALDREDLIIPATRYYMGRRTIGVTAHCHALARAWPDLSRNVQDIIRRDLEEEFRRDDAMRADEKCSRSYYPLGDDCDREAWEMVRAAWGAVTKSAKCALKGCDNDAPLGGVCAAHETSAAPGDDLPQKLRAMRDVPADKLHRSFDAAAKNRGGK